jgi:hypothetical protein
MGVSGDGRRQDGYGVEWGLFFLHLHFFFHDAETGSFSVGSRYFFFFFFFF